MPVKPTPSEILYMARKEADLLRRHAEESRAKMQAEERERERLLHHMKCPKCGMPLQEVTFGDVHVDKCFSCEGMWLDEGELEVIREKDAGFVGRLTDLFRKKEG